MNPRQVGCAVVGIFLVAMPARPAVAAALMISAPIPHQVVQRVGDGGTSLGHAEVAIRADFAGEAKRLTWEYRLVLLPVVRDREIAWAALAPREGNAAIRVPAGGWYRLEIRGRTGKDVTRFGAVEPFGVGEVFLVAGQSYATNCNDERLKVSDARRRVSAFDSATGKWRIANDPQPVPDSSTDGSIWPPLGDALVKDLKVPVGFANVAWGATSSAQWLPDGKLHPRLVSVGKTLGRFRAVLWQQGESDVIARTTTEKYVANLKAIRAAAVKEWGTEVPWLLAKSTLHPTVYNDRGGEGRIRRAIDDLTKQPGFLPGPDTDTLAGENRGGPKSRRHFSPVGQRRAAEMWFTVLTKLIKQATGPK